MPRERTRLVKVTYNSKKPGGYPLGKKLFGYRSWSVKGRKKDYVHKPIVGSLEDLAVMKIGRSKLIMPEKELREVQSAIEESGGIIKQVEAVTMNENDIEASARRVYRGFIDPLISKMRYASEAESKELYISALENGMRMTVYFQRFLSELDDYGTPLVETERKRENQFLKRMKALASIADEDFEAAKLQTELFASDIEDLKDQILR